MEYTGLPEPLAAAMHLVEKTNDARAAGVEIDTAQILAAKVACVALREYYSRLTDCIKSGDFDPSTIKDVEIEVYMEGDLDL